MSFVPQTPDRRHSRWTTWLWSTNRFTSGSAAQRSGVGKRKRCKNGAHPSYIRPDGRAKAFKKRTFVAPQDRRKPNRPGAQPSGGTVRNDCHANGLGSPPVGVGPGGPDVVDDQHLQLVMARLDVAERP